MSDQSDVSNVYGACLEDLVVFSPEYAAEKIVSRVGKLDRADRMAVLMDVLEFEAADGETFWRIFMRWWVDFEFPHRWGSLIDLLRDVHGCVPAYSFMDPADRRFFDSLPDPVIIHRGSSGIFKSGVSWTTDKDMAEFFARRFADTDASVVTGRIRKEEIWAVFTGRKESEVLCDPDLVRQFELSRFEVRRDAA
jgi:hypothetical protein